MLWPKSVVLVSMRDTSIITRGIMRIRPNASRFQPRVISSADPELQSLPRRTRQPRAGDRLRSPAKGDGAALWEEVERGVGIYDGFAARHPGIVHGEALMKSSRSTRRFRSPPPPTDNSTLPHRRSRRQEV